MIQPIPNAMHLAQIGAVIANETMTIPTRFNGPAGSANGGYTCGLLAREIGGPAQVTLRRPPPLGVELPLERREFGVVTLLRGEKPIATAASACLDLEPPKPPTFNEAFNAGTQFEGFTRHPFPTCFVCGPRRAMDDGLRIFPGLLSNGRMVAAPWIPGDDLADDEGFVRPEFVWAALDCPNGWISSLLPPVEKVVVLGTLGVAHSRRVHAGRRYVLVAWPLGSEGRKFLAGAALWSDAGELHAVARATWIQVATEGWSESKPGWCEAGGPRKR